VFCPQSLCEIVCLSRRVQLIVRFRLLDQLQSSAGLINDLSVVGDMSSYVILDMFFSHF